MGFENPIRYKVLYCDEYGDCWTQDIETELDDITLLKSLMKEEEKNGAMCYFDGEFVTCEYETSDGIIEITISVI